MKNIFRLSLALLVLSTLVSCSDDDESPNASMVISVDGTDVTVTNLIGSLSFDTEYEHEGRALALFGNAGGNDLLVSVANWDFQNPPEDAVLVKDYFSVFDEDGFEDADCLELEGSVTLCEGALISYSTDTETFFSIFDPQQDGFIRITKCDGKVASGSFEVTMQSFEENTIALTGTFTNIPYTVYR